MMELLASLILRREAIPTIGRAVRLIAAVLIVVQALAEEEILAEVDRAVAGDNALFCKPTTLSDSLNF
jgi:hypothetical protein